MAWVILVITTLLVTYAIFKEIEGVAVAIWTSGVPSAVGLYANKQYQLRKEKEIKND